MSTLTAILIGFLTWLFSDISHFGMVIMALVMIARITPWKWDDGVVDSLANTYEKFKGDLKSGGDNYWKRDSDSDYGKDGWFFDTEDGHA